MHGTLPPKEEAVHQLRSSAVVTIQAMYFGRVHSRSDVGVYVPQGELLVSGGVCHPFLPKVGEETRLGDMNRLVAVLDRVLDGGVEHVVTGHAEVAGRPVVERWRDYYRDLLAGVSEARGKGLTLEKAQAELTLDRHFPCMRGVGVRRGGTPEDVHAANIAAVWGWDLSGPQGRRQRTVPAVADERPQERGQGRRTEIRTRDDSQPPTGAERQIPASAAGQFGEAGGRPCLYSCRAPQTLRISFHV
jgi:hypothetical protein